MMDCIVCRKLSTTIHLTLSAARITDSGIVDLAVSIKTMQKLRYLYLSSNAIGDYGVNRLCESFREHKTLSVVSLAGNRITKTGVIECISTIITLYINQDREDSLKAIERDEIFAGIDRSKSKVVWCR